MTDQPTLETMDAKLTRLIEEYKTALQWSEDDPRLSTVHIGGISKAEFALAQFVAFHPELVKANPFWDQPLANDLLALPMQIKELQKTFDTVDMAYQEMTTTSSINALNEPLFFGKDGTTHVASNDTERKLAIDKFLSNSQIVAVATKERDEALRELQCAKNRFEAARLLVQLVCRENKK